MIFSPTSSLAISGFLFQSSWSMSFDISGKTILVTGANRGIGKAIVETFLEHGAGKIIAAVRSPENAQPLIDAHGDRIEVIQMDLGDAASVQAAADAVEQVDMVINNAAVLENGSPLDEKAVESWDTQSHINVNGLLHVARAFKPHLKTSSGVFAQVNSSAAMRCSARFSIYAATKAAAYLICQGLKEEFSGMGVRMMSVHPGPMLTDMAVQAKIEDIAEPPETVALDILEALKEDQFLVFSGVVAGAVGEAYSEFAKAYVE